MPPTHLTDTETGEPVPSEITSSAPRISAFFISDPRRSSLTFNQTDRFAFF